MLNVIVKFLNSYRAAMEIGAVDMEYSEVH